ncbi:MAG: carbamate kinase [Candidatus Micrarchaeia archaeon]
MIVIGLGGNALLNPKGRQSVSSEMGSIRTIARGIAALSRRYRIVLTHGNGTQVGDELLKNISSKIEPLPLYLLNAETQGSVGSVLETALNNAKPKVGFCTILTHALVDRHDSAFRKPSKPIGPFYTRGKMLAELRKERFDYVIERGMYRRVVPSPKPVGILEIDKIRRMLSNFNVICGGGGGIPVYMEKGMYAGIDAVIDKDYTTALIASLVGAKKMVILTNTDYVYRDINDRRSGIAHSSAKTMKALLGSLEEGSIRPKVDACIRFLESGGESAHIGSIYKLVEVVRGRSGTTITQ